MTQTGGIDKKTVIQKDFVWGIGPEALYQITWSTKQPDKIAVKNLIRLFNECFLPKRNTYHKCIDLLWMRQTETETPPKGFWRRQIEIQGISAKNDSFRNL